MYLKWLGVLSLIASGVAMIFVMAVVEEVDDLVKFSFVCLFNLIIGLRLIKKVN